MTVSSFTPEPAKPESVPAGTREDLGGTAATPPGAAEGKTRGDEITARIGSSARAGLARVKVGAAQAKQAVQNPENAGRVKGGGGAAAGTTALAMVLWAVRRRRHRPKNLWQKPAATKGRKGGAVVLLGSIAGMGVAYRVLGPDK
ncbi:MAG: hypothetical protein ABIS86_20540 [Streptosporangiaceae bacterium]